MLREVSGEPGQARGGRVAGGDGAAEGGVGGGGGEAADGAAEVGERHGGGPEAHGAREQRHLERAKEDDLKTTLIFFALKIISEAAGGSARRLGKVPAPRCLRSFASAAAAHGGKGVETSNEKNASSILRADHPKRSGTIIASILKEMAC